MASAQLAVLSRQECLGLLRQQVVGRVVFSDADGPLALPVNYTMAGDDIVFATREGSKLAALGQSPIAFEVDDFWPGDKLGWSVLVRGVAREVDPEFAAELLRRIGGPFPTPWAWTPVPHWVHLVPRLVSGRRLVTTSVESSVSTRTSDT